VYEIVYTNDDPEVRLTHCQRFGRRVKELRAEREITQEELAERVGVFRTYMSRIETGAANPTLTVIHALADALSVDVVSMFQEVDTVPPPRTRSRLDASRGRVRR